MVEDTELKSIRPPWIASPAYEVSWISTNRFKIY